MAASPTTNISFQNFFSATLTADLTASGTDVFIDTIPNGTEGFLVIDPLSSGREIIYYNSKTSTKVVCPSVADGRGQDDTSASSHLTGTTVIMAPIAAYYETLLSLFTTTPQGWTALAGTFTSGTYNGNRSYTFSTSTDQSSILSPGMRFRSTRTVAAPTRCTSLNGTNQSFAKATPAGSVFTGNFTCMAWVKLAAYGTAGIIDRDSAAGTASGWGLITTASGQAQLFYRNATGTTTFATSQSLPLNKWVHVAATATVATPTMAFYFDGVLVPSASISTAATTVVQPTTSLTIGNRNSSTAWLSGKIAQAAAFSAALSQATIQSYISQGLLGSETSLISAYSFDNSINDLNTGNANNLTAAGAAVATNADSPYGCQAGGTISSTLDYGIITAVTASTITFQVAEGCTVPTSGGVSAAYYSTQRQPFGFPGDTVKWTLQTVFGTGAYQGKATPTIATWYIGSNLTVTLGILVPVGSWNLGFTATGHMNNTVSGTEGIIACLSSSTSAPSDNDLTAMGQGSGTNIIRPWLTARKPLNVSAATSYYMGAWATNGGSELGFFAQLAAGNVIYAECAYL